MLAQNFLTADALQCSEADREAAIRVLAMLERQELVQCRSFPENVPNGFTMGLWWSSAPECGTVGCLGGWMEHVKGSDLDLMEGEVAEVWNDLFCPAGWCTAPEAFTIDRCAKALRAKLTTGVADWSI